MDKAESEKQEQECEPGPSGIESYDLEKRTTRRSQTSAGTSSACCPVCGVTIRLSEVTAHFQAELEKLDEVRHLRSVKRPCKSADQSCMDEVREERRQNYKRVKQNRSHRLTAKTGPPSKRRRFPGEISCPVCNDVINQLTEQDRTRHVDKCLGDQNHVNGDLDVEGASSESDMEEYEWAGQTRVRASTSAVVPRSNANSIEEDTGDLDVDGDEETVYGPSQFTEADLISTSRDNASQRIREAMVRTATANNGSTHVGLPSKWDTVENLSKPDGPDEPAASTHLTNGDSSSAIVESLKARIREIEKCLNNGTSERNCCLVCMQSYTEPLVSVSCWHVYCQDCWLKTLGCKKLCPQCSMITGPGDLRRIYI